MTNPNSPFNWRNRTEPSIFATDPQFRATSTGKTGSQIASESVEARRVQGVDPKALTNIGVPTKEKVERLLAYKQFGVYSRAKPSIKKPNKHEK
jgi:hypothetical protein